jgi:FkbM family methyltransferase
MSAAVKLRAFASKPFPEKWLSIRFRARYALAKVPFLPTPLYLSVRPGLVQWFAWHRFVPAFTPASRLLEFVSGDNPELRFVARFLRPGMTFLDVGAYHGIYSLIAARRVAPGGKVIAFEPCARDRRRLWLNRVLNGAWALTTEACALGASAGQRSLFVVLSGYTTMSSLRPPNIGHPVAEVPVHVATLDGYCAEHRLGRIDLMKIDAEGAEADILTGGESVIKRCRPLIICEVLDWVAKPWGRSAVASVDYLRRRGYTWFEFIEDGSVRPHVRREEYPEVRNYLAVPDEKLATIDKIRSA